MCESELRYKTFGLRSASIEEHCVGHQDATPQGPTTTPLETPLPTTVKTRRVEHLPSRKRAALSTPRPSVVAAEQMGWQRQRRVVETATGRGDRRQNSAKAVRKAFGVEPDRPRGWMLECAVVGLWHPRKEQGQKSVLCH